MAQKELKLYSSAFKEGGVIPAKYTCDGEDISLPLSWENVPEKTKSLILIMDDPDTPSGQTWDHWVLFNIPPTMQSLAEGEHTSSAEIKEGKNSWSKLGYGGPCPPNKEHRYFFSLFALDTILDLPSGATKQEVQKAIQGHILGAAKLMGRYDRKKG